MRELTPEQLKEMWDALARSPKESVRIYEAVEQIRSQNPAISRQEAFRRLSESSGQKLGNISTAYYRQARRLRSVAAGRAPASPRAADPDHALDELQQIAQQLSDLAAQLVERVTEERRELEVERERIERAKKAIIDA